MIGHNLSRSKNMIEKYNLFNLNTDKNEFFNVCKAEK